MWVYKKTQDDRRWLYIVGYYFFGNEWVSVEDFRHEENARRLVNYLNGGTGAPQYAPEVEG
jgi:hypothetical protein